VNQIKKLKNFIIQHKKSFCVLLVVNLIICFALIQPTYNWTQSTALLQVRDTGFDDLLHELIEEQKDSSFLDTNVLFALDPLKLNPFNIRICLARSQASVWKSRSIRKAVYHFDNSNTSPGLLSIYFSGEDITPLQKAFEGCYKKFYQTYSLYRSSVISSLKGVVNIREKTENEILNKEKFNLKISLYKEKTFILRSIVDYMISDDPIESRTPIFITTPYWSISRIIFTILKLLFFNICFTYGLYFAYTKL